MNETLIISLIAGIITFVIGFAIGRNQRSQCQEEPDTIGFQRITPDQVEADNPHAREVIAQAFNSGEIVTGFVDDSGELHTDQFPMNKDG